MDERISQLNSLVTADQADVYPIVDTSTSETKKITQEDLEVSIANSDNFTDTLIANTNFTTDLGNDTNLINTITGNATFQTAVNSFVTGGGGGGGGSGGTKLAIDTTEVTITGTTTETDLFSPISIPENTLGTNNAIRFKVQGSNINVSNGATNTLRMKYGSTTLATLVIASGQTSKPFELEGYIIADGSTSAQKGSMRFLAEFSSADASCEIDDGTATEVSTGALNLTLTSQSSSGADSTITVESIIVEKLVAESTTSLYVTTPVMVGISGVSNLAMNVNTTMYLGMVDIPTKITVSNVSIGCQSVNANGTISFAVYSESGATRLIQGTTATISASGTVVTAITPVTLDAGKYYVGYHSNGSANLNINDIRFDPDIEFLSDIGSGPVLVGTTTITASTTPTTITPASITNGVDMPIMRFS